MCTLTDCVCVCVGEMDAEDLILDEDYVDGSDDDEPLYEFMNETNSISQSSSKLKKYLLRAKIRMVHISLFCRTSFDSGIVMCLAVSNGG